MSADNITQCPQCMKRYNEGHCMGEKPRETLCEYYEHYYSDGKFIFSYRGVCRNKECYFMFVFNTEQKVNFK